MDRAVFTAEDIAGEIWYVSSRPGYDTEDFHADVLKWVQAEDGDMAPPELTLYRWPSLEIAGGWLEGIEAPGGEEETWTTLARKHQVATVTYEYPGEYVVRDSRAV